MKLDKDSLLEKIEQIAVPRRYDLRMDELKAICDEVCPTQAMCFTFRLGFLRGQQAARAEVKKEERSLMARDTSGWYMYLRRWLDRNNGNLRLLELMGVHAQSLEQAAKENRKKVGA